jgi:hypothetical protein
MRLHHFNDLWNFRIFYGTDVKCRILLLMFGLYVQLQHIRPHLHFTLWTLYRSYFNGIRANIELQVYSGTCC